MMNPGSHIVAVVTTQREKVGGGAPIFYVGSSEELEKWSFSLEKIMNANAHELSKDTMIIVKHS